MAIQLLSAEDLYITCNCIQHGCKHTQSKELKFPEVLPEQRLMVVLLYVRNILFYRDIAMFYTTTTNL